MLFGVNGNRVRFPDDPVTVIGEHFRRSHCVENQREKERECVRAVSQETSCQCAIQTSDEGFRRCGLDLCLPEKRSQDAVFFCVCREKRSDH